MEFVNADESRISWSRGLRGHLRADKPLRFRPESIREGIYRPFTRQRLYFDRDLNETQSQLGRVFASKASNNLGIVLTGVSSHYPFTAVMVDQIPDLHTLDTGQFFPRWKIEKVENDGALFDAAEGEVIDGYRRIDNVTDEALGRFLTAYGPGITKDDVFFYVYGLLHCPDYRTRFAADLKKMLPRIPLVANALRSLTPDDA